MGRFADLRRQLRGERMALSVRRSAAELATQAAGLALLYGTYGWLAWRAVAGEITLGDLVMFEAAFSRGQGFLRDLLAGVGGLYENNLFLSNLFEFLDLTPRVADPPDPLPVPRPMREGFAFEGVSFRYPGEGESAAAGDGAAAKPREALHGIDFRVGPGEVVALVGENGSGKTTLIKLLCRLYEPTDGRITLDGTDVRRFGSAELRRQIAVIFQDFVRYHVTARDNIRFGNLDLGEADPQGLIPAAARASAADAVIGRLPAGYETMLGRRFENGAELSLGEWQKVALARAFVRDAQVIVMDEPTAAMDAKAEAEVFDNFRRLAAGRAAVLISHRLSTVKSADRIYVLDRGTVAEVGTHDELMSRRGLYARMFELQARNYR
jgi:ATP-binding cassette subfamily B protein